MSFDGGAITGKLGLNISEFAGGMVQASNISHAFGPTVTAFITQPLLAVVDVAKQVASAIKDAFLSVGKSADEAGLAAKRLGVSVEFFSGMSAMVRDAGGNTQAFAEAMKFLQRNAADAAIGNDEAAKSFRAVGLSVEDVRRNLNNTEALFASVQMGFQRLGSTAEKTRIEMALFGRGGTEIGDLLGRSAGETAAFQKTLVDLGGTVTTQEAMMGRKFGQMQSIVEAAWEGIKKAVTAPIFEYLSTHFDEIVDQVKEAAGHIRDALSSAMKELAPYFGDIIKGAIGFGEAVAIGVSGMIRAFAALMPTIKAVLGVVESLAQLIASILVPAMQVLSPILAQLQNLLNGILKVVQAIIDIVGAAVEGVSRLAGFGGDSAGSSSAGENQSGGGKTTIQTVNVNVAAMDANAASSALAAKLHAPLQQAMRDHVVDHARAMTQAAKIKGTLKGK